MTVAVTDPAPVMWVRSGGTWVARGRTSSTTTPLPEGERPTGPKYVRYEDLYAAGNSLRQVIAKVTGGKVLTLPVGEFTWSDFSEGYVDGLRLGNGGHVGCGGLAGSGRDTVLKMVPGSSTHAAEVASISASSNTNPAYLININRMDGCEFRNFSLIGSDLGHEYNGLRVDRCNDPLVDNLYLRGASPGSANSPPGETFGINFYMSPRATLANTEVDGRHPVTGERNCSSPVGWNSTSDALVRDCYFHHGRTGMLTFWKTVGVTVQDTILHSTASGSGNQSGSAINLEEVSGPVRIYRCTHRPWGRWEVQHGQNASDVTDNTGLHLAMASGTADMPDVRVYDPIHDRGPHSSGAFAVMIGLSYPNQKVTSFPRVWKGATELIGRDSGISGYGTGVNAATHFVRYR